MHCQGRHSVGRCTRQLELLRRYRKCEQSKTKWWLHSAHLHLRLHQLVVIKARACTTLSLSASQRNSVVQKRCVAKWSSLTLRAAEETFALPWALLLCFAAVCSSAHSSECLLRRGDPGSVLLPIPTPKPNPTTQPDDPRLQRPYLDEHQPLPRPRSPATRPHRCDIRICLRIRTQLQHLILVSHFY